MPSYTVDDEIESIFYAFVSVLCDGRITWDKGDSMHQLLASRFTAMYGYFDHQLEYAQEELHPILSRFHKLLFGNKERKLVDIESIIGFFESEISRCSQNQ